MAPLVDAKPLAHPVEALTNDKPLREPVPAGNVCLLHAAPPLEEARMTPAPQESLPAT